MPLVKKIINKIKKERPFTKHTEKPTVIDGEKVDDLISWVKNLVEEAKRVRDHDIADFGGVEGKSFADLMKEYELWDIGNHWNADTTPEVKNSNNPDLRVENRIHQTLDVIVSSKLANRPQVNLTPEAGAVVQSCDALEQALSTEFDEMEFDRYFRLFVRNTRKFGFAVLKNYHTFLQNEPDGADIMYVCDPLSILWVIGTNLEGGKKVKALIEVKRELKTEVEREFNVTDVIGDNDITQFDLGYYMNKPYTEESSFEQVVITRLWLDDTTMITEEVTNEVPILDREGEPIWIPDVYEDNTLVGQITRTEKIEEKRRKYPDGRRIVVCGDTLLFDDNNPYAKKKRGHGLFPYVKLVNGERVGHFCGISDIELIKDQQKEINSGVSRISVNAGLTAVNQRIVDESALAKGFSIEDWNNNPGLNVPAKQGRVHDLYENVKQEGISSESVVQKESQTKAMEDISGAIDIARGVSPAAESGAKIGRLDVIQQRRGVPFIVAMELAARRLAKLEIGNLFQFKPEDEQFTARLELPDPKDPNKENPELPFTEQLMAVSWGELKEQDLKYKIKIGFMSSVASYRQAKFQEIFQLLTTLAQYLPPQLVAELALKYSDVPEIYDFYKKWMQGHQDIMEMFAQGQMGGGQISPEQIQALKQMRTQEQFGPRTGGF